MIVRSARWGVVLFLIALALLGGVAVATVVVGPNPPDLLIRLALPALAFGLGVLALFAGHVSYPRVQNLRVYLAGYSVGLQSVIYALSVGIAASYADAVPAPPVGYEELLFAVALLLSYGYTLLPPFPTYRTTRIATWLFVGTQVILLAGVRFLPASVGWLTCLVPDSLVSIPALTVLALVAGVVIVNAVLKPQSFYLRGAFSGLAVLSGGAWLLVPVLDLLGYPPVSPRFVALLYVAVVPLYLIASTIAHVLARMEHRVSYDPLLQIYNRQYCNQVVAEQSSIATRPPLTIMMIDIDHFKQVNDSYGHQAGDRILFAVAQMVQKSVVPEGIVCRYGGEELIVFIPGRSGRDTVPLAERLRGNLERMETSVRAKRISVTVSIGMSDRRSPRVALKHVIHAADKALYIAKENGRNQVRFVRITEKTGRGARP